MALTPLQRRAIEEAIKAIDDIGPFTILREASLALKEKATAVTPSLSAPALQSLIDAVDTSKHEGVEEMHKQKYAALDWLRAILNEKK